jgi:hypothetical protein
MNSLAVDFATIWQDVNFELQEFVMPQGVNPILNRIHGELASYCANMCRDTHNVLIHSLIGFQSANQTEERILKNMMFIAMYQQSCSEAKINMEFYNLDFNVLVRIFERFGYFTGGRRHCLHYEECKGRLLIEETWRDPVSLCYSKNDGPSIVSYDATTLEVVNELFLTGVDASAYVFGGWYANNVFNRPVHEGPAGIFNILSNSWITTARFYAVDGYITQPTEDGRPAILLETTADSPFGQNTVSVFLNEANYPLRITFTHGNCTSINFIPGTGERIWASTVINLIESVRLSFYAHRQIITASYQSIEWRDGSITRWIDENHIIITKPNGTQEWRKLIEPYDANKIYVPPTDMGVFHRHEFALDPSTGDEILQPAVFNLANQVDNQYWVDGIQVNADWRPKQKSRNVKQIQKHSRSVKKTAL